MILFTILIISLSSFAFTANAEYYDSIKPAVLTSVESASATSISLEWTDDDSFDQFGYIIYRAESKKGDYSEVEAIYNPYARSYTDKGLTCGKKYYYKVGKGVDFNIYFSEVKSATTKPEKMSFSAVSYKKNKIKLKWNKAEKEVDGYVIYRASSKNGTYSKIERIKDRTTTSYTDTDVEFGKFYYYKMKSYTTVDGKKVYGAESDPVRNKVDISQCQIYFIKIGQIPYDDDKFEKLIQLKYGDYVLTEDEDYFGYASFWSGGGDGGSLGYANFTVDGTGKFTGEHDFGVSPINEKTYIENANITNSGIEVNWEEETGALGYKIYRKVGSGSYSAVKTISDNSTVSWIDEDADKIDTKYKYFVRAYTKKGTKTLYAKRSNIITVKRLSTPKLKSVVNKKEGILFKWRSVKGAKSYAVYRKTNNSDWKYLTNTTDTQYLDKSAKVGKVYTYTVCCSDDDNEQRLSRYNSKGLKRKRLIVASGKSVSSSSVKITWNKATTADGYAIYRATSAKGTYKKIKTIKGKGTLSFTDKKLTFAKYYYYKVRPYYMENDKKVYGEYGKLAKVRPTLGTVSIIKAKATSPSKLKLTWEKLPKSDGYQIYKASSKNGTYKRVKTVSGNGTTSYTVTKLKNAKTYYFKVRGYRKSKGKVYYGDYSSVKSYFMDELGYAGEWYSSKAKRIWGGSNYTGYYKSYKSSKAAEKDMKTIKIKTWDLDSNGKKYTRYHYLTVHKNIAPTVEQIFKEIYKGKERFPIKSVGGYSWRGERSEHCEGLAIDINPNENAQMNGATGKPLVGSFWKPGKNPYSVTKDGDVVRIFKKYGFGWGNWYSNPDYMHFSYFGT